MKQTNRLLAGLHNGKDIFFADPGKALLSADGASPQNEFMKDVVHPNARGYEVLEKELAVLLKSLMQNTGEGSRRESIPDDRLLMEGRILLEGKAPVEENIRPLIFSL